MANKSLGLFLLLIGGIFIVIAVMTIWSMFLDLEPWKGVYIILSIPLLVFGASTMAYGIYSVVEVRLSLKKKGLILIIDALIPILVSFYTLFDTRIVGLDFIRFLVLFPLILLGFFLLAYGLLLFIYDKVFTSQRTKVSINRILGIIALSIGGINIVCYIIVLLSSIEQPVILSVFWLLIGIVLIIFGIHLIIKKVTNREKIN